jgi:hypothetical protein
VKSPRHRRRLVLRGVVAGVLLLATALVLLAVACLDMSPIIVENPPVMRPDIYVPRPDVEVPDGADAAAFDVDLRPPCQMCLESPDQPGPGCAQEVAACNAIPQCAVTYACVVSSGCLYLPTRAELAQCAIPCLQEAGITSMNTPAGMAAYNLTVCGFMICTKVCGPIVEGGAQD